MNNNRKSIIIFIIVLLLLAISGSVGAYIFFKSNVEEEYVTDENKVRFFNCLSKNNIEQVLDINEYINIMKKIETTNNETTTSVSINTTNNNFNGYDINKLGLEYSTKSDKANLIDFADIKLRYVNNDIISIQEIKENNKLAIKSDEIVNKYVGLEISNFKTILNKLNPILSATVTIPDNFNDINISNILYIDNELKESTISKYKDIIYSELKNDKFSIQSEIEVSVDGKSYTTTAYNVTLTGNEVKDLSIKILNEIKNDDAIITSIVDKSKLLERNNITAEGIKNEIQKYIDNIQNKESTNSEKMKVTLFENEEKLIKVRADIYEYADIELDLIDNQNEDKAILTYLNKSQEQKNGINVVITRNVNNKIAIDLGVINDGKVIKKIIINNLLNGNSESSNITNNLDVTYREAEKSTTIKLESKVNFKDVVIDRLTNDNCLFLDTLSDNDLNLVKQSILEKIVTVYKEKIETLNIINNNMQSTIISVPENNNQ